MITTIQARMIPIGEIVPSPYNTRRVFDQAKLEELAGSMKTSGIVEPLIVRANPWPSKRRGAYELVAGEQAAS